MNISSKPIVRFPPSPTGNLHIGSVRTALFNYLFAKKHGGRCVLRMEDTDKERSKFEFETNIVEGLTWLGFKFDGDLWRQSERSAIYRKYLERIISEDKAYISDEEAAPGKRLQVIRIRNSKETISYNDLIHGKITIDTTELGDFIIAKDLDSPLYHFAVVVDDHEAGVTHVIRGEDGIYNTPRQILIQRAIGAAEPQYAHLPFILGQDKKKLSKRTSSTALTDYRDNGYLPEAILNFLATLGWTPQAKDEDRELFSFDELVSRFDTEKVHTAPAIFNMDKLNWMNQQYLRKLSDIEYASSASAYILPTVKTLPQWDDARFEKMAPLLKERLTHFGELKAMCLSGELDCFFSRPTPDPTGTIELTHIPEVVKLISEIPDSDFSSATIKSAIWDFATQAGRAKVLAPMRIILSGKQQSPDPFSIAGVIGKEETLVRLKAFVQNNDK